VGPVRNSTNAPNLPQKAQFGFHRKVSAARHPCRKTSCGQADCGPQGGVPLTGPNAKECASSGAASTDVWGPQKTVLALWYFWFTLLVPDRQITRGKDTTHVNVWRASQKKDSPTEETPYSAGCLTVLRMGNVRFFCFFRSNGKAN